MSGIQLRCLQFVEEIIGSLSAVCCICVIAKSVNCVEDHSVSTQYIVFTLRNKTTKKSTHVS